MTRRQHRKDKKKRLQMKSQEEELNYKPEDADPDKVEAAFQAWRRNFLEEMKTQVFPTLGTLSSAY